MNLRKNTAPFKNLLVFSLLIGFLLRGILLLHPITNSDFTFWNVLKIYCFGALSDFFLFVIVSAFLWLYLLFLSNSKLQKPWGYIIFGGYLALLLYIISGKSILSEYGGVLPTLGLIFIGIKTLIMGLLLLFPKYHKPIRLFTFTLTIFLFVLLIIQNAVSEFFFWNEFGVRYNFIAVDYLVYTNTVIGNIMESYPVIPLFIGVGVVTIISTYLIVQSSKIYLDSLPSFKSKLQIALVYSILFGISLYAIPALHRTENSKNVFVNELQANGVYKFYSAFMNSELDFYQYYPTLKDNTAFVELRSHLRTKKKNSTLHSIKSNQPEVHKNVVLITVESLSAEFMEMYGNQGKLTPFLDSLAKKSLNFSNLYATGNRTVRGLEAVTLCLPPTPGESVVKRVDNKKKFSTGSLFRSKGYTTKYLYGGDAYFDNMRDFFEGNEYDIVDKTNLSTDEITFSNIWGVCDEDMANKAIKVITAEAATGKPFFNHWMTVSNHRPFTYPDGKIDIPSDAKMREGGVKYTDYALKQFFTMAEKQPWFFNTVFVIVADHCASSSGKTELPVDKYHIPAMIYAPGFIEAKNVPTVMSQIDLMPTLFGLLHFNYESKFFGQDVFKDNYYPRALIATYEDLGYIENNTLTLISPVRKQKQFELKVIPNPALDTEHQLFYEEVECKKIDAKLLNATTSYYQTAAYMLQNHQYQQLN